MGSQSVTNFDEIRMKAIQKLVKGYSPGSGSAMEQVRQIGAAAVTLGIEAKKIATSSKTEKGSGGGRGSGGGAAASGPANEFGQALSSRSVDTALSLIMMFVNELNTDPKRVYKESGVGDKALPFVTISSFLRKAHAGMLTASQAETDSAFAASDAIPKTIIDVVAHAFPDEKQPVEVDQQKFARAFKKVPKEKIVTIFKENVASALINLVLDATRGSLSPGRMNEVKQSVRKHFIPEFIEQLKKGK